MAQDPVVKKLSNLALDLLRGNELLTTPEVVERMITNNPDLVEEYWEIRKYTILGQEVRDIRRADAEHRRRVGYSRNPTDPVNPQDSIFDTIENVVRGNVRVNIKLGDMTRSDHLALAAEYADRARSNLRMELVHRALARGLKGQQKTRSVFTEDEVLSIMQKGE